MKAGLRVTLGPPYLRNCDLTPRSGDMQASKLVQDRRQGGGEEEDI